MLEFDWSGKVVGSVAAGGFINPSSDGSKFIRSGDQQLIEDWQGRSIGSLNPDLDSYGFPAWAEDSLHLCGIAFPSAGSATSQGSLWVLEPGQKVRIVGPVGIGGSGTAVQSCSISTNRVVVAAGASPHWPPGATRYLITTEVAVVDLSTGAVEYHHVYPQGNMGGQRALGPRGDWVLVTPSPDGRYLAETGVFSDTTNIRDISTDRVVATFPGNVAGFSSDDSRVVVGVGVGPLAEVRVMTWQDQHLIWRAPGASPGVLARPNSSDLLIGISNPSGNSDLVVVKQTGATTIARNAVLSWMCPCHPGA